MDIGPPGMDGVRGVCKKQRVLEGGYGALADYLIRLLSCVRVEGWSLRFLVVLVPIRTGVLVMVA